MPVQVVGLDPLKMTFRSNTLESQDWIKRFLDSEICLAMIPSWVLVGKRCTSKNEYGRCEQPVYGKGRLCYYHEGLASGAISPAPVMEDEWLTLD